MTAVSKGSPALRWVRKKVVEVFGADLRSLAAFRIVLAVLVLIELANRVTDLSAHYTDQGVLPRSVLLQEVLDRWQFSINLVSGQVLFQALLFGVAVLAALGLLVGYRTRLMSVILWVLLLSIQYRNPLVAYSGDVLLRMLLFWAMFLPIGAYWSVDRALNPAPPRLSMRFLSLATVGLFAQIAFVYWFTALLKSGREWRVDGTALYYALSIDQIATPIGAYLLHFPALLKVLTFSTLGLEAFGPFLLFFPFLIGPVRTGTALAFVSLHFGIWLTMDIWIFPLISALCMVCFLPGWFWDKALPRLRAALPKQPNVVHRLQHIAQRQANVYWTLLRARLSPAVDVGRLPVAGVVSSGEGSQPGSHAVRMNTPPAATAKAKRQGKTQRAKARSEQETRHGGGVSLEPPMLRSSLATNLFALFFLMYVFCWNLTTISSFTMPESVRPLGSLLGLKQNWSMFAPNPVRSEGWYVIPGSLRGGSQVDLMGVTHGDSGLREVSWEKPEDVASTIKNEHWRKYLNELREEDNKDLRLHLGRYICREWNARHTGDEQLVDFQITYMKEKTLPDYQRTTPEKVVLREHSCS